MFRTNVSRVVPSSQDHLKDALPTDLQGGEKRKQEEYISSHFHSSFIQTEQNHINCQTWETSQDQKRFENDSSSQPSIVIDELSPKRGEGTVGGVTETKKPVSKAFPLFNRHFFGLKSCVSVDEGCSIYRNTNNLSWCFPGDRFSQTFRRISSPEKLSFKKV